jgi:hypothetical protein
MKPLIRFALISAVSFLVSTAAVAAGGPSHTVKPAQTTLGPSHTGQPNQTCGSATAPNTPGNAAAALGSAFNPSGTAGAVYAGEQPQNSRNIASVSQYDVACFHQH